MARVVQPEFLSRAACDELRWVQQSQRRAGYMAGLSCVTLRELLPEPELLLPLIIARSAVHEAVEELFGEILYIE